MAEENLVRLGGVSGLLAVVTMIPAYLVGYPDAPGTPVLAQSYFGAGSGTFVFSNGVLPLFHVFFFILFLGVLYGMLRGAGGGARGIGAGLPAAALAGGNRLRDALGGRVHGGSSISGCPATVREHTTGRRLRARVADALCVALPLLSDRGVGHGAYHIPGGPGNGRSAEMVGPSGVRGCPANALALRTPSPGRPGGAGVGSGCLGTDARRLGGGKTRVRRSHDGRP